MLLGMLGLALVWLAQLPFAAVDLWWQRRHGLARVGYVEFLFGDWAALGAELLFLCLALLIVMGLARRLGRAWAFAAVPVLVGLTVLQALVSPWLVGQAHPLRRPALVADARALARQEGVAGTRVYVQDVHRQTSAPNAEALGLGPGRRVVLWDTLLDGRFSRRQMRVVIAHEMGHLAHRHLWKAVGWQALLLVPLALGVDLFTRRRGGPGQPGAVPVMLLVVAVLTFVASPLTNLVSRRMEAEADWSALRATNDPAAARGLFEGFVRDTDEEPSPPAWDVALFQNHPTLAQRIAMADAWAARHR